MLLKFTYYIATTIDVFITTDTKFTTKYKHFVKTHTDPIARPKCVPKIGIQERLDQLNNYMPSTIQCVEERSRQRRQKVNKKKKITSCLLKAVVPIL